MCGQSCDLHGFCNMKDASAGEHLWLTFGSDPAIWERTAPCGARMVW